MAGRRVPMLDSYMPPSSASRVSRYSAPGYDEQKEQEVRRQLDRHRRRSARRSGMPDWRGDEAPLFASPASSPSPPRGPVAGMSRVSRRPAQLVDRERRWEVEREACETELQYWKGRAEYAEDAARLLQRYVELPLRRALREEEQCRESLQAQLNIVAAQADERARALAAAEARVHAEAEGRRREGEEARRERQSLGKIEGLLEDVRRSGEEKVDQLSQQLDRVISVNAEMSFESRMSASAVPASPGSPAIGSPRTAKRLGEQLAQVEAEKVHALRERDARIAQLEQELAQHRGDPREGLPAVWELLWQLLHDTKRQRAGIRSALTQAEIQAPEPYEGPPVVTQALPQPADFARLPPAERAGRLQLLATAVVDEAGRERADGIAALRRVLEQHQGVLEQHAGQRNSQAQQHALDLQRLAEVERDRAEERRLFAEERERLQCDDRAGAGAAPAAAGRGAAAPADMSEAAMQTELKFADTYAQTLLSGDGAVVGDAGAVARREREREVDKELLADLTRSVEHRDGRLRLYEEQRGRFMSFVYGDRVRPEARGAAPLAVEDVRATPAARSPAGVGAAAFPTPTSPPQYTNMSVRSQLSLMP